jgi:hypothetical protein
MCRLLSWLISSLKMEKEDLEEEKQEGMLLSLHLV